MPTVQPSGQRRGSSFNRPATEPGRAARRRHHRSADNLGTPPSAQLALLQPLITPAIRKLAVQRYKTAKNLFNRERLLEARPEHEVKTALLLVHIMNPLQHFSEEEEALMRGISSKILRGRKARKELPRFL